LIGSVKGGQFFEFHYVWMVPALQAFFDEGHGSPGEESVIRGYGLVSPSVAANQRDP
jgi:hypothetical protein